MRRAGRVVRRAQEDDVGAASLDLGRRALGVDGEVVPTLARDPGGAGAAGQQRVHRVRRREPERGAPGTAEGLQDVLQDLVGAVRRPELIRA